MEMDCKRREKRRKTRQMYRPTQANTMTMLTTMIASIDEPTCTTKQQSYQQLCRQNSKLLLESREKGDINHTHPLDVVGTVIVIVRAKKQLSPRRVVA